MKVQRRLPSHYFSQQTAEVVEANTYSYITCDTHRPHMTGSFRISRIGLYVMLALLSFQGARAQCYLTWLDSFKYDGYGFNPKVAMSGSAVVEVHNGGGGAGPLWYRVGQPGDSRSE